jgi:hypothetical protein
MALARSSGAMSIGAQGRPRWTWAAPAYTSGANYERESADNLLAASRIAEPDRENRGNAVIRSGASAVRWPARPARRRDNGCWGEAGADQRQGTASRGAQPGPS